MELSIFDIIGNGVGNAEIGAVIKEKLQNKYKEKFLIKKIGNRYGSANEDTVTVYSCPKKNENLIFTATLNREQTKLEDDYLIKRVSYEIEKNIKNKFKENDLNIIIKAEIIGKNQLNEFLSVQEFINKYENTNFLVYIISYDEITNEILEKIFNNLNDEYENVYLKSLIYTIDKKDFEDLYNLSNTIPTLTSSIIEKAEIKNTKIMKLFEGKLIKID